MTYKELYDLKRKFESGESLTAEEVEKLFKAIDTLKNQVTHLRARAASAKFYADDLELAVREIEVAIDKARNPF